jgi:ASPIC and UnbV/FG-GAP-like repeat
MFKDRTDLLLHNPNQKNYGVAVADVDNDGAYELFVAGYDAPNLVLKWNGSGFVNIADATLADARRKAIGVAAGDFDGDGREEIYVLNTDTFLGPKLYGDRLFAYGFDGWIDLFSLPGNAASVNQTAGRSVCAIDRMGTGKYGFLVANYGGPMRLYELNPDGYPVDMAKNAGLALLTGGRALIAGPIVSPYMDIFAVNENSPNFFFRNLGNGLYEEIALELGIDDPDQHGRGVALLDANDDGLFDLVYGNWDGLHRLYIRQPGGGFLDRATDDIAFPAWVRTVIAADFDNDGYEEIFFNNIAQSNRLFGRRYGDWLDLDPEDALETVGLGTGAAVGDFDNDGRLELLIAHGEFEPQPLTYFHTRENGNKWLRISPLTAQGAPARGALVKLFAGGRLQQRVIDAGSGYLCQMEPVAHFGLGKLDKVDWVEVRWLNGTTTRFDNPPPCQTIKVPYPKK